MLPSAFSNQACAKTNEDWRIDLEKPNGSPANSAGALNAFINYSEMRIPIIPSGMKQAGEFARVRIEAGEVWTFVKVTENARPNKILGIVCARMFASNDVL